MKVSASAFSFRRFQLSASKHSVLCCRSRPQFTSDLFKAFAIKYGFNHITCSPYWSQSNGRAEAAVKSAKHILLTADDVDLALLSVRNTLPAGHISLPAQHLLVIPFKVIYYNLLLLWNLSLLLGTLLGWRKSIANYSKNKHMTSMLGLSCLTSLLAVMFMPSVLPHHQPKLGFLDR